MPSRPLVVSPPTVKHAVASPGDVGAPTTAVFQDRGTTSSTIYLVAQPSEYSEDVIPTELPGPERLFERYSEREMFDRLREQARRDPKSPKVYFPEEAPVSREVYAARTFPRSVCVVEPGYVCHSRLLFEQPNFERYGWDLGVMTPFVNVGVYWYDLAMLPYHYWTDPCDRWECSTGKCLPGDRVPLLWYCEKFSLTGLVAEGAVITGGLYFIP